MGKTAVIGVALATMSTAALAQASDWQIYDPGNGPVQAFVLGDSGTQLILKCDKPGKRKVFAVVVAPINIAPPLSSDKFESGPVTVRMDANAPWDDNWRFNDKFAMAVDQGNTRSLTRLLEKLDGASTMQIKLKPVERGQTIIDFKVAGAHDAIAKVYESCKDQNPVGQASR